MKLVTAFGDFSEIPVTYTCLGRNVSPPVSWSELSAETRSLVLLLEDMDAAPSPWTHWMVFDIPATTTRTEEGCVPAGGTEGLANNHSFGYEGPCPRYFEGTHHYRLSLYALDIVLGLPAASEKEAVLAAMKGHTREVAAITGLCISR
jgi:Raf kinase inhibitor-like YbhB/YbcL family protein